nr:hypothetical protein [uncultured Anaerostipes sp.]
MDMLGEYQVNQSLNNNVSSKTFGNRKSYDVELFIAVFLSSMLGGQLFGISLNKIALIPLEVALLLKHRSFRFSMNKTKRIMLLWYFVFFISSILGFRITTSLNGHYSGLILNIVQVCLFYIPLLLLISDVPNLKQGLTKAIILTARIQAVWGIAQFISLHLLGIDLNQLFFVDTLKGALGTQWVAWYFDGLTNHLRVTGLNYDPAYFALIIILGFCYEKNKLWRIVFSIVVVMASSRSGVLCIGVLWAFLILKSHRITIKQFLSAALTILVAVIGIYILYKRMPSMQQQVALLMNRFMGISLTNDDGSSRHILYYISALEIWFAEFGLIGKLFGVGPRAGGVAIVLSSLPKRFTLNNYMLSNAWVIECDFAEILLGNGLLGLSLLYTIYLKIYRNSLSEEKMAIVGIFIMGLMYGVVNTTLIQLFLICCIGLISRSRVVRREMLI